MATRLGYLFLQEGEPEAAREFFERALESNPHGACRARQGLAKVALATDQPGDAIKLATDSIRRGHFGAKTIFSWPILIAARRKLGGWRISERLIWGLDSAPAGVRARSILTIVRELRRHDMRQWREVADQWSRREGQQFPIVEAEIRKMVLASAKTEPGEASLKREAAERLLKTPDLSPNEWLAAAKEAIRAGLWEGSKVNIEQLVNVAAAKYGQDFAFQVVHSLALSCMMAKRHDLARPLLQRNIDRLSAGAGIWSKSVWALARMESFLGNQAAAAGLYRQLFEQESVSVRFRLQAQLLWAQALIAAGQPEVLLEARTRMSRALSGIEDPDIFMNFARQLQFGPGELRPWGQELFSRGEALALDRFRKETQPSVAIAILFKLARRQVHDFGLCEEAVAFWEGLDETKKAWLWSEKSCFWEYMGQLFEAYARLGDFHKAEEFARGILDDPATPPDGAPYVGVPLGRRLMEEGRAVESLELFDWLVRNAPTHLLCAEAWYWLALAAYRQGNTEKSKECAGRIRTAQGVQVGMLEEWNLDAKALLLLAGLDPARVDPQAVNYTPSRLQSLLTGITSDLELIPL